MFETSVVRVGAIQNRRRRTALFVISVSAHTLVVAAVIAGSIASVEIPSHAPDQYASAPFLVPVAVPPPLGNPNGGAAQRPAAEAPPPPPRTSEILAPNEVPEEIVPAAAAGDGAIEAMGDGAAGSVPGPVGVPWGVEGGPGDLDAPPSSTIPEPVEEKIYQPGGEVRAPVIIHRVEPRYPTVMSRNRVPATVVVRCVIDRNGRIRDPEVIVPAMAPFNQAVLEAIRQWRFTPGSLRGVAVETYLDLTVQFSTN